MFEESSSRSRGYARLSVNVNQETRNKLANLMIDFDASATDIVGQSIDLFDRIVRFDQRPGTEIILRDHIRDVDTFVKVEPMP